MMEICEKLHIMLREAEHETSQLQRRITAWKCLERGDLMDAGSSERSSRSYIPSHCWACSGSLAGHMLLLWISLFQAASNSVIISSDMVSLLLQDDQTSSKSLSEWKRLAVCEIALKSEIGASMIHDTLQLRMKAGQVSVAEILGQIICAATNDSPQKEKFVALAKEQLESDNH
mmetsp:Transcript_12066/g.15801  ORF Transcript_12066/g.15801 Transcript_12066/m.15801 type:complete len:174 (-) Transcript_12066:46-567(-)